jgi:beta-glucosidase
MKHAKLLLFTMAASLSPLSLWAQAAPETPPGAERVPPTPEQQKIINEEAAIPADHAAIKIDSKTTTPDGKPNENFGKPQSTFIARHQLFLERRKQPMDVLFVGDSITQGWEGKGGKVWRALFEAPYRAANFGISGDRTQHVLWRIEQGELDGISPKAVVLLIGTNNSAKNSPAQIAAGVAGIIEQIHVKIPDTKVILLNLLPRSFNPTLANGQPDLRRQVMIQTNEILAKMENGTNVFYLKLWDPFLDDKNVVKKELMPDALHPNEAGYEIMGKAIKDKLVEVLPNK